MIVPPASAAIALRVADGRDVPEMHRIRLSVTENRLGDPGIVTEESYARYIEAGTAWVAELAGVVAGFAVLDAAAQSVWALFVAPESEGKGIGRSLHDRLVEEAAGLGLPALELTTEAGSRAQRLYEAAGWRAIGRARNGDVRMTTGLGSRDRLTAG